MNDSSLALSKEINKQANDFVNLMVDRWLNYLFQAMISLETPC